MPNDSFISDLTAAARGLDRALILVNTARRVLRRHSAAEIVDIGEYATQLAQQQQLRFDGELEATKTRVRRELEAAVPASLSAQEREGRLLEYMRANEARTVAKWRPPALLASALFDKAAVPPGAHKRPHKATELELFAAMGLLIVRHWIDSGSSGVDSLMDACECIYCVAGPKKIPRGRDPEWLVYLKADIKDIEAEYIARTGRRKAGAHELYRAMTEKYAWYAGDVSFGQFKNRVCEAREPG